MVAVDATSCSAGLGSQKQKKNVREICQYLTRNRLDMTRFWRRVGDVLVCEMEALEQEMERGAGQRPQKGTVVGCCSCGVTHPSRDKRSGDRIARRSH